MALLEARNIVKVYPNGTCANNDVSFSVDQGEIHAIVGENGAGKTTLMRILYGMELPTSGQIYLRGQPVSIDNPHKAIDLGIGMVHQNFMLVDSFSVGATQLSRIMRIVIHASSAPQAPSVWPMKLLSELTGTSVPNTR